MWNKEAQGGGGHEQRAGGMSKSGCGCGVILVLGENMKNASPVS